MNRKLLFIFLYLFGVIISAFAQILLKKSADIERENKIKEYLNIKTITAYTIFFLATFCTVISYKYVPLSMGTILGTAEYAFIALLSYYLLKEKISKRKFIGLIIITIGILIYSI